MNLTPEGFGWLTRELAGLADRHAAGRLVSVLEGGYELEGLGRCVAAHVEALFREGKAARQQADVQPARLPPAL